MKTISVGVAMSLLFGPALTLMTLKGNGSAGHIYAVSTYLWMFAMSLDDMARLVEQYSNLQDISRRMQVSESSGSQSLHNGHKYPPSANALGHFLGDLYACVSARGVCPLKFVDMLRDCTIVLPTVDSDFQRRVWAELCAIPYNTTTHAQALAVDMTSATTPPCAPSPVLPLLSSPTLSELTLI